MIFLVLYWLYFCAGAKCSRVFTASDENTINVSDYCPKIDGCEEGTHVMCMYYNPKQPMGPQCTKGRNFTATGKQVVRILTMFNEMRSRVANGIEKGQDNQTLPRGYGIFRMNWDNELAAFAQIWANQCELGHDLCRATKKYSSPGQMTGVYRYKYPGWETVHDKTASTKELPDVPIEKVEKAIDNAIKITHGKRKLVTKEMIYACPDVNSDDLYAASLYLQVIRGSNTHVGCGTATYVDYYFDLGKKKSVVYNTVAFICNFSGEPVVGQKIYETVQPHDEGYTAKCGCPPGSDEDEDCLCVNSKLTEDNNITLPVGPVCIEGQCSPRVVILPIITVEDAPLEKLYQRRPDNISALLDDSLDIGNIVEAPRRHVYAESKSNSHLLQNHIFNKINTPYQQNDFASTYKNKRLTDVKNRYLNRNVNIPEQGYRIGSPVQSTWHVTQNRKSPSIRNSIFTRAAKFELPSKTQQNKHWEFPIGSNKIRGRLTAIKEDVTPRRDFTSLPSLVKTYLSKKHRENVTDQSMNYFSEDLTKNMIPMRRKFGFGDFNITVPNKNSEIRSSCDDNDNKVLTLLDNLEQQVKHIELNDDIRDIVDAKILKILNNMVGNPNKLTKSVNTENEDDLNEKTEKSSNMRLINVADNLNIIDNPTLESKMTRPLRINQNSLMRYEEPIYEHYRGKFTNFDGNERDAYINDFGKNDFQHMKDGKLNYWKDSYYYKTNDNRGIRKKVYDKLETNNYYSTEENEPLGIERQKIYQETPDKPERSYRSRSDLKKNNRYSRPMEISRSSFGTTRYTDMQPFYIPDRVKFLHGF